jgi:hypothetical protein
MTFPKESIFKRENEALKKDNEDYHLLSLGRRSQGLRGNLKSSWQSSRKIIREEKSQRGQEGMPSATKLNKI